MNLNCIETISFQLHFITISQKFCFFYSQFLKYQGKITICLQLTLLTQSSVCSQLQFALAVVLQFCSHIAKVLGNQSTMCFSSLQIQKGKSSVVAHDTKRVKQLAWNFMWPGTQVQPWAPKFFQSHTENSTPGNLYLLEKIVVLKHITAFLHGYLVQAVEMLQRLIVAQVTSTILRVCIECNWSLPRLHKFEIEIVRQLVFHQMASGKDCNC